jgi:membrane associated rhomboid family serine protease
MASRDRLQIFFRSYLPLVVLFLFISLLALIVTLLTQNNALLSSTLQLSFHSPWGIVTSLFLNYNIIHLTTNIIGLAFFFFFFSCSCAFIDERERKKRFPIFTKIIFVAGILANSVYLMFAAFNYTKFQNFSSAGTSAIVYSVEGAVLCFAILNLLNMKKQLKLSLKMPIIFFNLVLIIMPIYEVSSQLINANQVFAADHVNVLVHYYAFCISFLLLLFLQRNNLLELLKKKKMDV